MDSPFIGSQLPMKVVELSKWNSSNRRVAETVSAQLHKSTGATLAPLKWFNLHADLLALDLWGQRFTPGTPLRA